MDRLDQILSNTYVQMVLSAAVSWIFNKIVDPKPPTHTYAPQRDPSLGNQGSPSLPPETTTGVTPEDLRRKIEEALQKRGSLTSANVSKGDQDQTLAGLLLIAAVVATIYLINSYGILVVNTVRYLVFTTCFSALFFMFQGYKSGFFIGRIWAIKTSSIVIIGIICFVSTKYIYNNIDEQFIEAQRRGIYINSVQDFFRKLGPDRALFVFYQALALFTVLMVSMFSLLAQASMVLIASTARNFDINNWRVYLLKLTGNWASPTRIFAMMFLSGIALGVSSGWIQSFLSGFNTPAVRSFNRP